MGCQLWLESPSLWCKTPIEWEQEKCSVLTVTIIIVALLAFGAISYTYQGGRYADIPGYNQGYAYVCWSVASAVFLGASISYLVRFIQSSHFASKPSH